MAEIPLASYIGHIFLEIIKAREMADEYSKQVALRYSADDVMKHFSTPRFKASNIDLTIPVLISNASYTELVKFEMSIKELVEHAREDIQDFYKMLGVERQLGDRFNGMIRELFAFLERAAKEPGRDMRVHDVYGKFLIEILFTSDLPIKPTAEPKVMEEVARKSALFVDFYRPKVKISSSKIDSLLVNPETKIIKDGSSEASVFVVSAKMIEDGFFVHSVKGEDGKTETIVEHD